MFVRGFVQVALFVLIAGWSTSAMAQCACSLPANQSCPSACSSCVVQPVSCTCTTGCTFADATCSAGYAEIGQSGSGCFPGFVSALCQRTGTQQLSQCATCHAGRWGSSCLECPGGAGNPCNGHGTCSDGISGSGACICQQGYAGPACQYSDATTCNGHGTVTQSGTCLCDTGFTGPACSNCATGYFGYPDCRFCSAAITCSGHGTCSATGDCVCSSGFTGPDCGSCAVNYHGYPDCRFCESSSTCSAHGLCDASGFCSCDPAYAGAGCNACATDHYGYPDCVYCHSQTTCSGHGLCNAAGDCVCDQGYSGPNCVDCAATSVEAVCDDGIDADCDLTTDCLDTDCCTAGACAAADGDGDAYAVCDCDDTNPEAWATPGEALNLTLSPGPGATKKLNWDPPLEPGGNPVIYETLRFNDPRDFDLTALCLVPANPFLSNNVDAEDPSIGRAFFYLVRARSACPDGEGPLGTGSPGDPRTGTCP